ncbi:mandelate racemase/muconate lactonizing enzyme family protein [Paenarthrobacter nicotinovorans]|uniref:mandelate racemase/muconate lactonizing enzyme family protein n=1 Tax=Paenarthrobacter nicotinovorans TaxID=29320 RepID=UPI003D676534
MRITSIDIFEYRVDYSHGVYTMSHGRAAAGHPSAVVRVITDEGTVGWGEVCPNGRTYSTSFFEGERAALPILAKAIIGLDPRNLGLINRAMHRVLRGAPGAKTALDVACWDILGKSSGLPISELLGGTLQDEIPLALSIPVGTSEAAVDYVARSKELGVTNFQVKVGDQWADDVERVFAVVEAAGSGSSIVVDANGGWNLQSALLAVRQLDELPIHLEQPCASLADCAELRKHTSLPMILDESVITLADLTKAKSLGIAGVNIKPQRVGGLSAARLLRDVAQALEMNIECDDTWGGTLVTAHVAHLAASTDPKNFLVAAFFADWTDPAVSTAPVVTAGGGVGHALEGPGLGVDIDLAVLGEPVLTVRADEPIPTGTSSNIFDHYYEYSREVGVQ